MIQKSKESALIITGMHRSGTSLAAQWLYQCGLHLGDNLLGAHIGNNEGHYEDLDFLRTHEKLLLELGLPSTGLIHKPLPPLSGEQQKMLSRLIEIKKGIQQNWGWKEPRTCLLLPYYRRALPGAFYLVLIKEYNVVVSSLIMRLYRRAEKKYAEKKGLSRFIWTNFKQKRRIRHLLRTKATRFLQSWLVYNQAIYTFIKDLDGSQFLVADHQALMNNSDLIFTYLFVQGRFQELAYTPFSKLFKPGLQSKVLDIRPYIKDKKLLAEAEMLQKSLKSLVLTGGVYQ